MSRRYKSRGWLTGSAAATAAALVQMPGSLLWWVAVHLIYAQLLRADETHHGHRVGNAFLAFYIGNRIDDDWGCLGSVHIHNDDQPFPRGAGRPGQASGIFNATSAPTPLWQLSVSRCDESFPAAGAMLQSCSVQCERKYLASSPGDGPSAVLRWEGCTTGLAASGNGSQEPTLDIEVTVSVVGNVSTWGATVGKRNAAGLCLQSFTLPDLRTLRMTPDGGEELFMPYEFGAQGSCQDSGFASALGPWMPDDDAASCGDTSAGGGGDRKSVV